MAGIPSSSNAPLVPPIMATAKPKYPAKSKAQTLDSIDIVQTFISQNPDYEVKYELIEDGEEHEKTYQFLYKMGERVLARGDVMSKKRDAKRCAAQRTECVLRSEGYTLCGNSSKLSHGS